MNGIPEDFATFHDAAATAPALNGLVLAAVVLILALIAVLAWGAPRYAVEDPDPQPSALDALDGIGVTAPGWRPDLDAGTLRWHDAQGQPTARLAVWHD